MEDKMFGNFSNLLEYLNQQINLPTNIYRGYNNDDELLPSLIRKNGTDELEKELYEEFEKYSLAYMPSYNVAGFLSCAQHYGLPTRLLDFTYNPFIALFFALYEKKLEGDYYTIVFCDKKQFREFKVYDRISRFEIRKAGEDLSRLIDIGEQHYANKSLCMQTLSKLNAIGEIKVFEPVFTNQRIIMQQGLFLVSPTLNREKYSKMIEEKITRIKIHKNIREEALQYLDTIGFNAYRLMPDLSSVCFNIKKHAF